MAEYKFEDIAINSTQKKKPVEEDKYHYLGLEHLDPGTFTISRFGSEVAPIGEKLLMKKGDVLFGKRRAYQKKVAIAPFDGIFSAHGMVLRPKENVVDKDFFPLFIASDYFLDTAINISVGSLSPTINWRDLKELKFTLPTLAEQKKLAEVLWAIVATMESYKKLLVKTDELVKAKFVEMFGDIKENTKNFETKKLVDIVEKAFNGEWGKEDDKENGVNILRTTNFTDFGIIDYTDVAKRKLDIKKISNKMLKYGDVIIEKSGGSDTKPVGRVVFFEGRENLYTFNNFTSLLRLNDVKTMNFKFFFYFLFFNYWIGGTKLYDRKTTGIHNLNLNDYLEETKIILPPIELQNKFADFVQKTEESKSATQASLDSLTKLYKKIIAENLGGK